ncbi:MAG TPA: Hsp20/alpha crystallin family protein [Acidisarcina sp.]
MATNRWDPFREVASLQNRMNTLFQDFSRNQGGDADLLSASGFVPAVDVYEDEHKIVLKLEVPGVSEQDLDIRLENNTLSIRGERKFEKEEKEENFQRIERRYGSFYRAFSLPNTVDSESVQARYDAGVLRIELQRRAESKPKQIKVNIGEGSAPNQPKQVTGQVNAPSAASQPPSQSASANEGERQGTRTAA